jgi:hypothetical protein
VQHLTFNFPELNLVLLALILAMGQYTGYKLTELYRFAGCAQGPPGMISLLSPGELKRYGMLGMNARNLDFIGRYNQRRLYPLVDNKLKTKLLAADYEMPVPALRFALSRQHEVDSALDHAGRRWTALP